MSNIDERIVALKFDDSGFAAGANKAIGILDKLSNSLKFKNSGDGLSSVQKAVNGLSFNGIENGVAVVTQRFSAFQEFVTGVFRHLGAQAVNFGENLIKNVTLKPVTEGFSEYQTQMKSIQTISANTGLSGEEGIAKINSALDELNTYADKTIYNFTEMTRNIGTFTAAGIDLDTSKKAIQGIANLAAVSGSTSQQASTAMYQLSQALASGTVKLQDWNSVVNAGMGGKVFQEALKRTARAHNIAVDSMIEKRGSFRESLQDGWITSEVLTETLNQLAISYDEVGDEAYNAAMEQLLNSNYSKDDAEAILELAKTAEEAATMVRTWSQLWETVGEALGSGWSETFRIVIGDFNQATELFTWLSQKISDLVNKSSDARNNMLKEWADSGGRKAFVGAIGNLFEAIEKPILAISDSFSAVFGLTGEELAILTEDFAEFTESLVLTNDEANELAGTFDHVFGLIYDLMSTTSTVFSHFLSLLGRINSYFAPVISKFSGYLKKLKMSDQDSKDFSKNLDTIVDSLSDFGVLLAKASGWIVDFAGNLSVAVKNANVFHHVANILKNVCKALVRVIRPIGNAFGEVFNFDKSFFDDISGSIGRFLRNLEKLTEGLIISGDTEVKIHDKFKSFFELLKNGTGILSGFGQLVSDAISGMLAKVTGTDLSGVTNWFSEQFSTIDWGSVFESALTILGGVSLVGVGREIKKFIDGLAKEKEKLDPFKDIKKVLGGISDGITNFNEKTKFDKIKEMGIALGALAGSLVVLSFVSPDRIGSSLLLLAGAIGELFLALQLFSSFGSVKRLKVGTILSELAISLLGVSVSLKILSTLSWDQLSRGLMGIGGMLAALIAALNALPDSGRILSSGHAIKSIAVGLLLLSVAIVILSTVPWDGLSRGLMGIGGMLAALIAALNALPDSGRILSSATAIVLISTSLVILTASIVVLSTIPWDGLSRGLMGIGGMLAALIAALNALPDSGRILSSAIAIVAISMGLLVMSTAIMSLAKLSWTELAKGLVGVMASLLGLTLALNSMPDSGKIIASAMAIVMISGGILILSTAVLSMSSIGWEGMLIGLTGVLGMLLGLTLALNNMPDSGRLLSSAIAILAISGGILIMSNALTALSAIGWEGIAIGLVSVAGLLLEVGIALKLMNSNIGAAASLLIVSVGIKFLAESLMMLSSLTLPQLGMGLLAIGAAIGVICLAAYLCKPAIPYLLAIAGALLIIGIAAGAIVASVNEAGKALSDLLAPMMEAGENLVNGLVQGIAEYGSNLVNSAIELGKTFWESLCSFFGMHSPSRLMAEAGGNIVQGLINGIGDLIGSLGSKAGELGKAILDGIASLPGDLAKKAGDAGHYLITGIGGFVGSAGKTAGDLANSVVGGTKNLASDLGKKASDAASGFVKKISGSVGSARNAATSLVNGVTGALSGLASSLKNKAADAVKGMASGLSSNAWRASNAAGSLRSSAISGLGSMHGSFYNIGANGAAGLVDGLRSKVQSAANAAADLARKAAETAKAALKINSPSKVFRDLGYGVGEGFVLGIGRKVPDVVAASTNLADNTTESFESALDKMSVNIDDILDTDYNPVITPVIDSTKFDSSMDQMSSLLSNRISGVNIGNLNYTGELSAKIGDYADINRQTLDMLSNGLIDYDILGASVANALIRSGVHVEMDGGKVMGYIAGEIRDVRRMYK